MSLQSNVKEKNRKELKRRIYNYWELYLFMLPAIVSVGIFKYWPMYGVVMAFQNVKFGVSISQNTWIGLRNFTRFFNGIWFETIVRNTVIISLLTTIATIPFPIILALLIYNSSSRRLGKIVQNITYLPHLLSIVLVISVVQLFCNGSTGLINIMLERAGQKTISFFGEPRWVYPMYVISELWQQTGYSAIIYIGALAAVDSDLIEAAEIDGAGKLRRIYHIQIPCILPTIATMMVLNVGKLFAVGADKMLLLQTNLNLDTSEIISTYVYKVGMESAQYSFSTAVNLLQNVINLILVLLVNQLTKKMADTSIF